MKKLMLLSVLISSLFQVSHAIGPCGQRGLNPGLQTNPPPSGFQWRKNSLGQPIPGWIDNMKIGGIFNGGDYGGWPNGALVLTLQNAANPSASFLTFLPLDWDWAQHVTSQAPMIKKNAQTVSAYVCFEQASGNWYLERLAY